MFTDLIFEVLKVVVLAIVSVGAAVFIAYLRRKGWLEAVRTELLAKQELAAVAVRFAEQLYQNYDGPEKYVNASKWLEARLAEKSILVSDEEIRGLIEAALREIKDQFGNEWARGGLPEPVLE